MTPLLALYDAATRVAGPWLARRDRARLLSQGADPARVAERLGHGRAPRPPGRLVWLHAVSVGETQSILPLARRLLDRGIGVLVTTTTATGQAIAEARLPEGAHCQFGPLDRRRAVERFLDHWRPDLAVFVESEIWPHHLRRLAARGIPAALVNARLSERSRSRWQARPATARALFGSLAMALATDAPTAEALRAFGVPDVRVTGSTKASATPQPVDPETLAALRAALGGRPVWLAASTHPGEEAIALDAHARLLRDRPDLLLILAPRHPDRGAEVARLVAARGYPVPARSKGGWPGPDHPVYLADTLGEMGLWYAVAQAAFLGGSFLDKGGHNPLEAAAAGVPLVTGPDRANAAEAYAALAAAGAVREATPDTLAEEIARLLAPETRAAASDAARRTAASLPDPLDTVEEALLSRLP